MAEFKDLIGVRLASVEGSKGDEQMTFVAEDGRKWQMYQQPKLLRKSPG